MTPDETLESRVGKLEVNAAADRRDLAALGKRTDTLEALLNALAPLATQVATLAVNVSDLDHDVSRVEGKFDTRLDKIEALIAGERKAREEIRENERAEASRLRRERDMERAAERRWLIGLVVVILLGVLAASVTLGVAVLS